jgi:hypothetical protein
MFRSRREWAAERLAEIPAAWAPGVAEIHAGRMAEAAAIPPGTGRRSDAERAANLWLADIAERMRVLRVPLNLSDRELCQLARECAAACMDIAFRPDTVTDTGALRERMGEFCRRYGIEPPEKKVNPDTGEVTGVTDAGAIRRMGDGLWWRRRLRVAQGRAIEKEAIALGYVHRRREIYASTLSVERRAQQKRRNADALRRTVAVNQHGEEFTLAELAERAVSNPRIRRGKLMIRINGFESIAKGLSHIGMFFTVTCPSRMHAKKGAGKAVFDNPKFDGTTPREAQQYLSGMWAKCRAALARAGAAVYGFRIAEPHHDATPHWHLLLFMAAEVKAEVCRIFAKYARQEDAGELGSKEAREARFKAIEIDWTRGTAAGYVAKYVSKNIDGGGYQVQGDLEGGDWAEVTPSHRVETWASTWGIRQFQQVGGAPVGVWRELRRLKEADALTDTVRAARSAADVGNWARFTEVMGGPVAKRVDRPVSVAYTNPGERYHAEAEACMPAPLNRYGEEPPGAVFGVRDCVKGRAFVTRVFRWEIRRGNGGKSNKSFAASNGAETAGASGVLGGFDGSEGSVLGRLAGPWTRVNNCTEGVKDGCEHSGVRAEKARGQGGFVACGDGPAEGYPRADRGNRDGPGRSLEGSDRPAGPA